MLNKDPNFKGALASTKGGERAWCIWTRTFGENQAGNTLNILRFVIEGDEILRSDGEQSIRPDASKEAVVQAGAAVLRAAQLEAAKWNMHDVQLWNPTPLAVLSARVVEPSTHIIHRDKESIASLKWHGIDPEDRGKIEWIGNEKFGWC